MKRKHSFNFICGCALLLLTVLLIAGGLFLSPYGVDDMDATARNLAPSWKHIFGTDHYGRDVYTRVAHGVLTTVAIGAMTIVIGGIFGTLVGALAGYIGGTFDAVIMRINDCLLAFPSILLALVFVGLLLNSRLKSMLYTFTEGQVARQAQTIAEKTSATLLFF